MKITRGIQRFCRGAARDPAAEWTAKPRGFDSINSLEQAMAWTKPTFVDIRFGFEITMYIANR
jgi:coenzyme PQQ precursor peptide PqqA